MSSIPAVKAQIVALLKDALSPTTQVTWGDRTGLQGAGLRRLCVNGATGTAEFSSLALDASTEQYALELITRASVAGVDAEKASGYALADFQAAALAINSASFGDQTSVHVTGAFEYAEDINENACTAAIRFAANVFATV